MDSDKSYNIVKAALWYTVGNILIKGVSFFVLPIFTSLMSTTEYGIYSVYASYLTIFEVIILIGLSNTVSMARYSKELDFHKYISSIIILPVALAAVIGIIVNIYLVFAHELLSMDMRLWNCLLITAAAGSVVNIISARLVIDAKYKLYMANTCINTFLNVGLSLFLCYTVFASHDIYMARVVGSLCSCVVAMVFLLISTKIRPHINIQYLKLALTWGIPLLFHTAATVVLTQSDRIVIRYMKGYSAAGIYSIAVTIVTIPMVLQASLSSAFQPWYFKKLDEKDYKSIRYTTDKYVLIFAAIIAEFMLVCPEIIHLFADSSYWDSVYSLIPLSISIFGEMLYSLPVGVESYNRKSTYIMTGTIIAVCCNIVLDIIFVYMFDFVGAAYATAISKLLLFSFHCIFAKKVDPNSVFHKRTVIGSIAALALLNAVSSLTVDLIYVRWSIFAIILILLSRWVYKNKKMILEYVKR